MGARCRLCAEFNSELLSVLEDEDVGLSCKIEHLFQVKIVPEDTFTGVCSPCRQIVVCTWEFSERVQKAQEILLLEADISTDVVDCGPQLPQSDTNIVACDLPVVQNLDAQTPIEALEVNEDVKTEKVKETKIKVIKVPQCLVFCRL